MIKTGNCFIQQDKVHKKAESNSIITGMLLNVEDVKARLHKLFIGKDVIKAYLFGSLSRGTASKKSDIDILIVKETSKRFLDRFDEFNEIYTVLDGCAVDLLVYTPDEFRRNSHRLFLKRIVSEGVLIYEH